MLKLYAPDGYHELSTEDVDFITNGCGAANAKFDFVPDTVYGLSIAEACNIHDYMYWAAMADIADKERADRVFRNNALRIVEYHTKIKTLKFLRRRRVQKYYWFVDKFGGPAFWQNKNGDFQPITEA